MDQGYSQLQETHCGRCFPSKSQPLWLCWYPGWCRQALMDAPLVSSEHGEVQAAGNEAGLADASAPQREPF